MKRILAVLLLLWASTAFAHDTQIYSGGNVTEIINPSSTGTHTFTTGGAEWGLVAGSPPSGSQPKVELGINGTDDRVFRLYNITNGGAAVGYFGVYRARLTAQGALNAVQSGNGLGGFAAYAFDGTDYLPHTGFMTFTAAENITATARGTDWHLGLSPVGSDNMRARVYVSAGGNVDIKDQATPITPYTPVAKLNVDGDLKAITYSTLTNCSDGTATPADCTAAPAGSVIISAAATAVTVNTTAVTANSQIFIQEDSSLGTKLGVTCNTTIARSYAVTARTAATSFVITTSAAPITNPACLSYFIVN